MLCCKCSRFSVLFIRMILFLDVAVTLLEAIYATCGVNELALTCVERM